MEQLIDDRNQAFQEQVISGIQYSTDKKTLTWLNVVRECRHWLIGSYSWSSSPGHVRSVKKINSFRHLFWAYTWQEVHACTCSFNVLYYKVICTFSKNRQYWCTSAMFVVWGHKQYYILSVYHDARWLISSETWWKRTHCHGLGWGI